MILRAFFLAAIALLAGDRAVADPAAMTPEAYTIPATAPWGERTSRRYHVVLPPNLKRGELPPAVMILHDAGDDALAAIYRHGWLATASQARFAIIAPEAGLQAGGRTPGGFFNARVWNAGGAAGAAWNDVVFLSNVARDASRRLNLDPRRVYLVGFGEGGALAQKALADGAAEFAGFASVAGPLYRSPAPPQSRPLLLVHGLADPTNPVNGGFVYTPWGGRGSRAGLGQQVSLWAAALGCRPQPDSSARDGAVTRQVWGQCAPGGSLSVVWVGGLGRQWPGTGRGPLPTRVAGPANDALFAPWEIWRFLERRRLPQRR